MNINSISSSTYASQLTSGSTDKARQAPPPPPPGPPPGEGGVVSAIGSALESLGVTDVAAGDKESAASALGSFLQQLMTSLHEQGGADGTAVNGGADTADAVDASSGGLGGPGGAGGPRGAGGGGFSGPGGPGGPGRLAQDLKSLISSLEDDSSGDSSSSALETSFSSLLDALGADSSDSQTKLASFLQTLADKLPQAGSSGNLVNTTA